MKLQFFSVNALEPGLDQDAMDDFCSRHRIVSVDKQLVDRDDCCHWVICFTYLDAASTPTKPTQAVNKRAQVDYREVLDEVDFTVFSKLRDLRKAVADADGVPIYAVFSNAQLAEMVTHRTTSLTALGEINGVGTAKLDKYGKHFITLLKAALPLSAHL
jgi:superfamily II DNA helicase RecQ